MAYSLARHRVAGSDARDGMAQDGLRCGLAEGLLVTSGCETFTDDAMQFRLLASQLRV